MSHGIRRKPYQVLPDSGAKITCVEVNDDQLATKEWWYRSLDSWYPDQPTPSLEWETILLTWDFVLIVPLSSVQQFWCSNDGMTGWRKRRTGLVVPDYCRQTGGCPEVWNTSQVKGKRELVIANLPEIEHYVVFRHRQVRSRPFPEHRLSSI